MKHRKIVAMLLGTAVLCGNLVGCGSAGTEQNQGTQVEKTEGEEEVPTIVIYNNSGAFSVTGAEAGSDESVYKEM